MSDLNKNKLVQILSRLSGQEQNLFDSFIRDKNFNKHSKLISLYELLMLHIQQTEKLDKKSIYKQLFIDKTYDDAALRHLFSYLLKLLEQFGYWQYKNSSQLDALYHQLYFYNAIDFQKGIFESINQYDKVIQQKEILVADEIYRKYQIESIAYNQIIKHKRADISQLMALNKSLDEFFILSKLKVACTIVNQQNIFNQTIDSGFFKDLMSYAAKSYLSNKMIALYYHVYELISSNDATCYEVCTHDFEACLIIQNKEQLKDALTLLINFCIKQMNQGNTPFEQEVFRLYKIGIEFRILMEGEKLSPFTYSNALSIAIKVNDLEWAAHILENFKDHLDCANPLDYYALNKSKYLLACKKFDEALAFINQVEIDDLLIHLQFRVIQLKIFIELDEYRLATSYISNFKQLMKRKDILAYHKTNFNKIATYMQKLIQLPAYTKTAKNKLIAAIEKEPILSEKNWLIEKVKEA